MGTGKSPKLVSMGFDSSQARQRKKMKKISRTIFEIIIGCIGISFYVILYVYDFITMPLHKWIIKRK